MIKRGDDFFAIMQSKKKNLQTFFLLSASNYILLKENMMKAEFSVDIYDASEDKSECCWWPRVPQRMNRFTPVFTNSCLRRSTVRQILTSAR